MENRTQKIFELIISTFFILFSVAMLYVAYSSKVSMGAYAGRELEPFWFPKVVLYVMLTMSLCCFGLTCAWFVRHKSDTEKKVGFSALFHKKSVMTYILILVYILLWKFIGFSFSTFLYFTAQTKVMDPQRPITRVLIVSLLFTGILYITFSMLFNVRFPEPILDLIF